MTNRNIDILLSTYNGEKYLDEQILSIINQTDKNWKLFIRDDGSNDRTLSIISNWQSEDTRIQLISDTDGNLGSAQSFIKLLSLVENDIFMFCDQDDIWKESKLSIYREIMEAANPNRPLLCYSDSTLIDDNGNIISDSFYDHKHFTLPRDARIAPQLIHNVVVGCTSAGNKSLANIALKCPKPLLSKVIMHDWWLANLALLTGELKQIDLKSIYYRIHQHNVIGAKKGDVLNSIKQQNKVRTAQNHLKKCQEQAKIILDMTENEIKPHQKELLKLMINKNNPHSLFSLFKCFIRGIRMSTLIRNMGIIAGVIISSKEQ